MDRGPDSVVKAVLVRDFRPKICEGTKNVNKFAAGVRRLMKGLFSYFGCFQCRTSVDGICPSFIDPESGEHVS